MEFDPDDLPGAAEPWSSMVWAAAAHAEALEGYPARRERVREFDGAQKIFAAERSRRYRAHHREEVNERKRTAYAADRDAARAATRARVRAFRARRRALIRVDPA